MSTEDINNEIIDFVKYIQNLYNSQGNLSNDVIESITNMLNVISDEKKQKLNNLLKEIKKEDENINVILNNPSLKYELSDNDDKIITELKKNIYLLQLKSSYQFLIILSNSFKTTTKSPLSDLVDILKKHIDQTQAILQYDSSAIEKIKQNGGVITMKDMYNFYKYKRDKYIHKYKNSSYY